jgi:hypothetical protein
MGILAWVVAPLLALTFSGPTALPRALIVTLAAGLIWHFAWVLIVVRHEQGSLRSPVIKKALWLNAPVSPPPESRRGDPLAVPASRHAHTSRPRS